MLSVRDCKMTCISDLLNRFKSNIYVDNKSDDVIFKNGFRTLVSKLVSSQVKAEPNWCSSHEDCQEYELEFYLFYEHK